LFLRLITRRAQVSFQTRCPLPVANKRSEPSLAPWSWHVAPNLLLPRSQQFGSCLLSPLSSALMKYVRERLYKSWPGNVWEKPCSGVAASNIVALAWHGTGGKLQDRFARPGARQHELG